jgi:heme o synthase
MAQQLLATVQTRAPAQAATRLADYIQLTRPRLSGMALLTVAAGAILASGGTPNWPILMHALIGAALVAAGASAVNQWLERDVDARMRRTQDRPLPVGRLQPGEVFVFGIASAMCGVAYLAVALASPLAAVVAALTFLIYVFAYTPLKRVTPFNTLVGGIAGALPPVIGWSAVRGSLNAEIAALFAILFLWQVPHFLAIAWIYRGDYGRAGLRMLPSVDRDGRMTGRHMISYCLALFAVSLVPLIVSGAGWIYLIGALVLGIGYLVSAVAFSRRRSVPWARAVLRVSLIYLPVLLTLLLLDRMPR